jgi:threonine/homoserine/homoserine lactone efflux protein
MSLAFLVTSLIIIATPGTGAILTIGAGIRGGRRLALVTAFGCTLGIVPHLVAAITGTAALLRLGGVAFEVLRWVGIAYLLYMAFSTWRSSGALGLEGAPQPRSTLRTIGNAILANLLNPKLTLFFFAFLPQFVSTDLPSLPQMLTLSGTFMALTLVVFAVYGLAASFFRRHLVERPSVTRRIQKGFALGYVGIGVGLATTHR